MAIHRVSQRQLVKAAFIVAIAAAATNGAGVNCFTYRRACALFQTSPTGAATTSDCKLQESNDNGATDPYADVPGGSFTQGTTAAGATVQLLDIDLAKRKQWIRLVHTGAGAAVAGVASGSVVLVEGQFLAPAQDLAAVSV